MHWKVMFLQQQLYNLFWVQEFKETHLGNKWVFDKKSKTWYDGKREGV